MLHYIERNIWIYKYIVGAIFFVALMTTIISGDHHWMNRFGALLVAFSLSLTFIQFTFEGKAPKQIDEKEPPAQVRL